MINNTVSLVAAAVLPVIIINFLRRRYKTNSQEETLCKKYDFDNSYYHCMFWTMDHIKCKEHIINNFECGDNCAFVYLQTILKFISSAEISISMCMFHLTVTSIADELIKARDRGITVRIITDCVTSKIEHSKMNLLKTKYGFDVRSPPYEDSFMHHKFCIIDGENPQLQKMFFGSLNLTLQGCCANFEFVVITNNQNIIPSFKNEFNLLWKSFEYCALES